MAEVWAYSCLSLWRWLIRYPHDFYQQCLLFDTERSSGNLIVWTVLHLKSYNH